MNAIVQVIARFKANSKPEWGEMETKSTKWIQLEHFEWANRVVVVRSPGVD